MAFVDNDVVGLVVVGLIVDATGVEGLLVVVEFSLALVGVEEVAGLAAGGEDVGLVDVCYFVEGAGCAVLVDTLICI